MHCAVIKGHEDVQGLAIWFTPHPNKKGNEGPFSNFIIKELMKSNTDFLGLKFYDSNYLYECIDGETPEYKTKNGAYVRGPIFCFFGIEGLSAMDNKQIMRILLEVNDQMIEYLMTKTDWKMPCYEPMEESIHDDKEAWSDVMPREQALSVLINLCEPTNRGLREPSPGPDENTWGKANLDLIKTFFRGNSLTQRQCARLGLPEEDWMVSA